MTKTAKSIAMTLLNYPSKWVCRREYGKQTFLRFNERPVEYAFVFRKLAELYPRRILDVGTGTTALPHLMRNCGFLVTATDNVRDYWPDGMSNRHYHIINDDITKSHLTETFDLITCISVLEHIEDADSAVANMFRLLNRGGHLVMTFPYTENAYVRNVFDSPDSINHRSGYSFITQSFSRAELERWLQQNNGQIVDQEYWQYWDRDQFTLGNQIIPPHRVNRLDKHQLSCVHILKNKGLLSALDR